MSISLFLVVNMTERDHIAQYTCSCQDIYLSLSSNASCVKVMTVKKKICQLQENFAYSLIFIFDSWVVSLQIWEYWQNVSWEMKTFLVKSTSQLATANTFGVSSVNMKKYEELWNSSKCTMQYKCSYKCNVLLTSAFIFILIPRWKNHRIMSWTLHH